MIFTHTAKEGIVDKGVALISDLFGSAEPPDVRNWDQPKLILGAAETELEKGNLDLARANIARARQETQAVEAEWKRYLGGTGAGAERAIAVLNRVAEWSEGLVSEVMPGGSLAARAVFNTVEQASRMGYGLQQTFSVEELAWEVSMSSVTGAVGDVVKAGISNQLGRVAAQLSKDLRQSVPYEVFCEFLGSGGSEFVTQAFKTAAEGVRDGNVKADEYAVTVGNNMISSGMRDALWKWLELRRVR